MEQEKSVRPSYKGAVLCGDCGRLMYLREGKHGWFWCCVMFPRCYGAHGAHQETGAPLGEPGDRKTRRARKVAHASFDRLWRRGYFTRAQAYRWLADRLKLTEDECHIGRFTIEQCGEVQRVVDYFYSNHPAKLQRRLPRREVSKWDRNKQRIRRHKIERKANRSPRARERHG